MRGSLLLLLALGGLLLAPHGSPAARTGPAEPCLETPDITVPGDAPDDGPDDHSAAPSHDALSAPDTPPDAPAGGPALAAPGLTDLPPQPTPAIALPRQKPRCEALRLGGRVAAFATVEPPPPPIG